eukprot:901325-Amphidinium_carterae.1
MMLPAVRKTANVEFVEVTEIGAPLPTIAETPQYVEDFKVAAAATETVVSVRPLAPVLAGAAPGTTRAGQPVVVGE